MDPLFSAIIPTEGGNKSISVFVADILNFDQQVDILTTSAYYRSYGPSPRSLFGSLNEAGISVRALARAPEIDLRSLCNVWLSTALDVPGIPIRRIGCVEMIHAVYNIMEPGGTRVNEGAMLNSIKAYFQMLDIAATCGVKMDTVAVPMLGSGSQNISMSLTLIPIINECVQFLKRNGAVKRVYFIERNPQKAFQMAQTLANSYSVSREQRAAANSATQKTASKTLAFISYASPDRNVADNLCAKLEARGIKVWYAPRNVHKDYATAIAEAIASATHFIVILSKSSMASEHVLNEIDLAFKGLPNNIKFKPLRIDEQAFAPAFDYYLSRQHWMEAHIPPLEERLTEFVDAFMEGL